MAIKSQWITNGTDDSLLELQDLAKVGTTGANGQLLDIQVLGPAANVNHGSYLQNAWQVTVPSGAAYIGAYLERVNNNYYEPIIVRYTMGSPATATNWVYSCFCPHYLGATDVATSANAYRLHVIVRVGG